MQVRAIAPATSLSPWRFTLTHSMLGILGGTFDPIHFGHLRTGLEVREALCLDELRFVPCRQPPHREQPHASSEQRAAMVRLALQGQLQLRCDERELRRAGPSYTVDTLIELRAEMGKRPLCLVIGADALAGITAWHEWQRLIELAHLVVMHRPGWEAALPAAASTELADRQIDDQATLAERPAGCIWYQAVTPLEISASAIRAAVQAGRSIDFLLPAPVARYIHDHRLYLH